MTVLTVKWHHLIYRLAARLLYILKRLGYASVMVGMQMSTHVQHHATCFICRKEVGERMSEGDILPYMRIHST